jgi:hypothetical protein
MWFAWVSGFLFRSGFKEEANTLKLGVAILADRLAAIPEIELFLGTMVPILVA